MTLEQIETAVRAQRANWTTLFRRAGAGWQCILFPRRVLTDAEYQTLAARLSAPTAADRKRNDLQAKAVAKHG
jgi:hypothetical protein